MRDELRIITMRLRGQLDREIAEARELVADTRKNYEGAIRNLTNLERMRDEVEGMQG